MSINKRDLIEIISQEQDQLPHRDIELSVKTIISSMIQSLKKGKRIDYEGATNVEFDVNGDALGTFLEKEVSKGKFKTRQQR